MNQCLLIGIGGVYNYGCEAIVRGTERILHHWYPHLRIVYASPRAADDRRRLADCDVKVNTRHLIGRCHPKNIARKALSLAGLQWYPMRDRMSTIRDCEAVLSIGGDIYTIHHNGSGPDSLIKFGDACQRRGVPYILWGASAGPFEANPLLKARVAKHLASIHRITAREETTVAYLKQLGVSQNVVKCADPAFVVAPDLIASRRKPRPALRIGVNLSPLSALQCGFTIEESALRQAGAIQRLMDVHKAAITLLPHVVCDLDEMDDDLRYLARVRSMMPNDYKSRVHLVENDPGFIGIKQYMMECDLVIAARMHCAINAVAAQVPALILAYSNKAIGMGHYIYGNDDWTMPLGAFSFDAIVDRVAACLDRIDAFHAGVPDRLALIRMEAYGTEAPL